MSDIPVARSLDRPLLRQGWYISFYPSLPLFPPTWDGSESCWVLCHKYAPDNPNLASTSPDQHSNCGNYPQTSYRLMHPRRYRLAFNGGYLSQLLGKRYLGPNYFQILYFLVTNNPTKCHLGAKRKLGMIWEIYPLNSFCQNPTSA